MLMQYLVSGHVRRTYGIDILALAGVLPLAKFDDNRTNDLIRLQQMFPRIVAAEYPTPRHISSKCQDLLSRMLTADPTTRITISQVQ